MNRLVFVVEGDCELSFVNQKIIPFLYSYLPDGKQFSMNAQKVTTNRKSNKKGGNVNYEYLKNEIKRISAQDGPWITTFFDFFRLPNNFPCYSTDSSKIDEIEKSLFLEMKYEKFIPYIQKHEFEALMFADCAGFYNIDLGEKQFKAIFKISEQYPNVEDINGGQSTAPSKRLERIFNYHKVFHSHLVLDDVNLEAIMARSPRFKSWILSLANIVSSI